MRDRSSFCVNPVDGIIFQSCWTSGGFVHLWRGGIAGKGVRQGDAAEGTVHSCTWTMDHHGLVAFRIGACLDLKFSPKFYYTKRRFFVTSKYRQMHWVLNVDKIKN
jgi:hypothetical protein